VFLALGSGSEGLIFEHNGDLNIGGTIFSNGVISLKNPSKLKVTRGKVWAWGNCTRPGNVTITNPPGTIVCNASTAFGGVKPKVALDPGDPTLGHAADWEPAGSPTSMVQPTIPPGCTGPVTTATLNPGVYYDSSATTGLGRVTTTCATTTLNPGVYFLDFPDDTKPWSIPNTVTALCDGTGQGAQLVFGDESKLDLSGTLAIPCGRKATATGPLIALYGLKNPVNPSGPFDTTLRPTVAADTNGGYFTATAANALPAVNPAYPQDGTQAHADIPTKQTAELTVSNFTASSGPALTANAALNAVSVSVAHDESGVSLPAPTLSWGTCSATLTPVLSSGPTVWTSGDLSATFAPCAATNPSAMSLAWNAKTPNGSAGTADLDGVQVHVNWSNPGIPAQNGCMATVGGCSVINLGSNSGELDVNDVVYLPQDKLEGKLNLNGSAKIATAFIARDIDLDINPNICGSCAAIGGDTNSPLTGKVRFQASIGGTLWSESYVTYAGDTLKPTINSWVIRH
jgi:hypothetical protein